jgi:hypothetical protein
MAFVKKEQVDLFVTGEFKHIRCVHWTWVEEDGVMIGGKSDDSHVISPGDDASNEPQETQDTVAVHHTPALVDAYKAFLAEKHIIRSTLWD